MLFKISDPRLMTRGPKLGAVTCQVLRTVLDQAFERVLVPRVVVLAPAVQSLQVIVITLPGQTRILSLTEVSRQSQEGTESHVVCLVKMGDNFSDQL